MVHRSGFPGQAFVVHHDGFARQAFLVYHNGFPFAERCVLYL